MKSATTSTDPLHKLNVYEVHHLASHLLEIHEYSKLHKLLELEATNRRNAWFEAKSRFGDGAGYLAEIATTWKIVEQQNRNAIQAGHMADGLPRQLRYAFISAAMAGMAAQPSGMLRAFVERGLWTPQEAVAYSLQINDWQSQLRSVTALAEIVSDIQLRNSCEKRAFDLISKGTNGFPSRTVVGTDSEMAWSDYMLSAQCLDRLARILPDHLVLDAVTTGKKISNWFWGIYGLRNLCGRLAPLERQILVEDLWTKATQLRLRFLRAEGWSILAPLFEGPDRDVRIEEALHEAVDLLNDWEARKIIAQEPRSGTFTFLHDVQKQLEEDVRPLRLIAPYASVVQLRGTLPHVTLMDELPRYEALLILLPELAAKDGAAEAMKWAGQISHPVYRNLIKAAVSPFLAKTRKHSVLRRARLELAALEESEVRCFCLAILSQHLEGPPRAAVLWSVIHDVERLDSSKLDSLCASVLRQVAKALPSCPERQKLAITRAAFKIAKGIRNSDQDLLISSLVPWLDVSDIHKEFQDGRSIAFGTSPQALREAWSQSVSKQTSVAPKCDYPRPADLLLDALAGAETLSDNQKSRLVMLASPMLGPETWQLGIEVARSISSKSLKGSALWALTKVAPESLKSDLGLETLETIWAASGGIERAASIIEELVHIVAVDRVVPLFESWSSYLRSVSRESWQTMLGYLKPMRCVFETLGGGESSTLALNSIEDVERWFGKRESAASEAPDSSHYHHIEPDRFSEMSVPSTTSAILEEIFKVLIEAQQFQRARHMLSVFQGTEHGSNGSNRAEVRMENALFTGLSGAGRFKEATELLSGMEFASKEGVNLLVRRLVSHGRTDEAQAVLEMIVTRHGAGAALCLASVFVEIYLAEDRVTDALSLFQRLELPRTPGAGLDCCTDMAFMLGNFFLKKGNKKAAKDTTVRFKECDRDLRPLIATRLLYNASRLRDNNRALFWHKIAKQFEGDGTLA